MPNAAVVKLNTTLLISHLSMDWVVVQGALSAQRYAVRIAHTGYEALRLLFTIRPDLILLNETLPDLTGEQLCRRIRNFSDVPILFLVEADLNNTRYSFLDCGLTDYLIKPLQPMILLKQVQQTLRYTEPQPNHLHQTKQQQALKSSTVEATSGGIDLILDHHQYQVILQGEVKQLSVAEYQLLIYLMDNAGRILTHAQIAKQIWGAKEGDQANLLQTLVWRLRRKIEQNPKKPKHLLSHYGIGYSFNRQGIFNTNLDA